VAEITRTRFGGTARRVGYGSKNDVEFRFWDGAKTRIIDRLPEHLAHRWWIV